MSNHVRYILVTIRHDSQTSSTLETFWPKLQQRKDIHWRISYWKSNVRLTHDVYISIDEAIRKQRLESPTDDSIIVALPLNRLFMESMDPIELYLCADAYHRSMGCVVASGSLRLNVTEDSVLLLNGKSMIRDYHHGNINIMLKPADDIFHHSKEQNEDRSTEFSIGFPLTQKIKFSCSIISFIEYGDPEKSKDQSNSNSFRILQYCQQNWLEYGLHTSIQNYQSHTQPKSRQTQRSLLKNMASHVYVTMEEITLLPEALNFYAESFLAITAQVEVVNNSATDPKDRWRTWLGYLVNKQAKLIENAELIGDDTYLMASSPDVSLTIRIEIHSIRLVPPSSTQLPSKPANSDEPFQQNLVFFGQFDYHPTTTMSGSDSPFTMIEVELFSASPWDATHRMAIGLGKAILRITNHLPTTFDPLTKHSINYNKKSRFWYELIQSEVSIPDDDDDGRAELGEDKKNLFDRLIDHILVAYPAEFNNFIRNHLMIGLHPYDTPTHAVQFYSRYHSILYDTTYPEDISIRPWIKYLPIRSVLDGIYHCGNQLTYLTNYFEKIRHHLHNTTTDPHQHQSVENHSLLTSKIFLTIRYFILMMCDNYIHTHFDSKILDYLSMKFYYQPIQFVLKRYTQDWISNVFITTVRKNHDERFESISSSFWLELKAICTVLQLLHKIESNPYRQSYPLPNHSPEESHPPPSPVDTLDNEAIQFPALDDVDFVTNTSNSMVLMLIPLCHRTLQYYQKKLLVEVDFERNTTHALQLSLHTVQLMALFPLNQEFLMSSPFLELYLPFIYTIVDVILMVYQISLLKVDPDCDYPVNIASNQSPLRSESSQKNQVSSAKTEWFSHSECFVILTKVLHFSSILLESTIPFHDEDPHYLIISIFIEKVVDGTNHLLKVIIKSINLFLNKRNPFTSSHRKSLREKDIEAMKLLVQIPWSELNGVLKELVKVLICSVTYHLKRYDETESVQSSMSQSGMQSVSVRSPYEKMRATEKKPSRLVAHSPMQPPQRHRKRAESYNSQTLKGLNQIISSALSNADHRHNFLAADFSGVNSPDLQQQSPYHLSSPYKVTNNLQESPRVGDKVVDTKTENFFETIASKSLPGVKELFNNIPSENQLPLQTLKINHEKRSVYSPYHYQMLNKSYSSQDTEQEEVTDKSTISGDKVFAHLVKRKSNLSTILSLIRMLIMLRSLDIDSLHSILNEMVNFHEESTNVLDLGLATLHQPLNSGLCYPVWSDNRKLRNKHHGDALEEIFEMMESCMKVVNNSIMQDPSTDMETELMYYAQISSQPMETKKMKGLLTWFHFIHELSTIQLATLNSPAQVESSLKSNSYLSKLKTHAVKATHSFKCTVTTLYTLLRFAHQLNGKAVEYHYDLLYHQLTESLLFLYGVKNIDYIPHPAIIITEELDTDTKMDMDSGSMLHQKLKQFKTTASMHPSSISPVKRVNQRKSYSLLIVTDFLEARLSCIRSIRMNLFQSLWVLLNIEMQLSSELSSSGNENERVLKRTPLFDVVLNLTQENRKQCAVLCTLTTLSYTEQVRMDVYEVIHNDSNASAMIVELSELLIHIHNLKQKYSTLLKSHEMKGESHLESFQKVVTTLEEMMEMILEAIMGLMDGNRAVMYMFQSISQLAMEMFQLYPQLQKVSNQGTYDMERDGMDVILMESWLTKLFSGDYSIHDAYHSLSSIAEEDPTHTASLSASPHHTLCLVDYIHKYDFLVKFHQKVNLQIVFIKVLSRLLFQHPTPSTAPSTVPSTPSGSFSRSSRPSYPLSAQDIYNSFVTKNPLDTIQEKNLFSIEIRFDWYIHQIQFPPMYSSHGLVNDIMSYFLTSHRRSMHSTHKITQQFMSFIETFHVLIYSESRFLQKVSNKLTSNLMNPFETMFFNGSMANLILFNLHNLSSFALDIDPMIASVMHSEGTDRGIDRGVGDPDPIHYQHTMNSFDITSQRYQLQSCIQLINQLQRQYPPHTASSSSLTPWHTSSSSKPNHFSKYLGCSYLGYQALLQLLLFSYQYELELIHPPWKQDHVSIQLPAKQLMKLEHEIHFLRQILQYLLISGHWEKGMTIAKMYFTKYSSFPMESIGNRRFIKSPSPSKNKIKNSPKRILMDSPSVKATSSPIQKSGAVKDVGGSAGKDSGALERRREHFMDELRRYLEKFQEKLKTDENLRMNPIFYVIRLISNEVLDRSEIDQWSGDMMRQGVGMKTSVDWFQSSQQTMNQLLENLSKQSPKSHEINEIIQELYHQSHEKVEYHDQEDGLHCVENCFLLRIEAVGNVTCVQDYQSIVESINRMNLKMNSFGLNSDIPLDSTGFDVRSDMHRVLDESALISPLSYHKVLREMCLAFPEYQVLRSDEMMEAVFSRKTAESIRMTSKEEQGNHPWVGRSSRRGRPNIDVEGKPREKEVEMKKILVDKEVEGKVEKEEEPGSWTSRPVSFNSKRKGRASSVTEYFLLKQLSSSEQPNPSESPPSEIFQQNSDLTKLFPSQSSVPEMGSPPPITPLPPPPPSIPSKAHPLPPHPPPPPLPSQSTQTSSKTGKSRRNPIRMLQLFHAFPAFICDDVKVHPSSLKPIHPTEGTSGMMSTGRNDGGKDKYEENSHLDEEQNEGDMKGTPMEGDEKDGSSERYHFGRNGLGHDPVTFYIYSFPSDELIAQDALYLKKYHYKVKPLPLDSASVEEDYKKFVHDLIPNQIRCISRHTLTLTSKNKINYSGLAATSSSSSSSSSQKGNRREELAMTAAMMSGMELCASSLTPLSMMSLVTYQRMGVTEAALEMLYYHRVILQQLHQGIHKLHSFTPSELKNEPLHEVSSSSSIINHIYTVFSNLLLPPHSSPIGLFNIHSIICGERERLQMEWQATRKLSKKEYVKELMEYERLCQEGGGIPSSKTKPKEPDLNQLRQSFELIHGQEDIDHLERLYDEVKEMMSSILQTLRLFSIRSHDDEAQKMSLSEVRTLAIKNKRRPTSTAFRFLLESNVHDLMIQADNNNGMGSRSGSFEDEMEENIMKEFKKESEKTFRMKICGFLENLFAAANGGVPF